MRNFKFLSVLAFASCQEFEDSWSQDFLDNPREYYRNPCPKTRPTDLCNAFDEYVWKKDGYFSYELRETYTQFKDITGYAFLMKSQKWLNESIYYIDNDGPTDPERTVWKHWVNVWVPKDKILDKKLLGSALMLIDGSGNSKNPPNLMDDMLQYGRFFARTTGNVFVGIKQIPNGTERLIFLNDWKCKRTEDGIIALTWRHFLDFPDEPEWLLRFPMTKATLRAMDMVSEFVQTEFGWPEVTKWGVTGASKRGWTTWMTAAADPERVVMMAPIVLDFLKMDDLMHQMFRNTGNWTFTFTDYWYEGVNGRIDDPNMKPMMDLIDPFSYKDRFTMPKVVISATGDEFFMPDDINLWWDEMPEPKFIRMMPNTDHSTLLNGFSNPHLAFTIRSTYLAAVKDQPLPEFTWDLTEDKESRKGRIDLYVTGQIKPSMIFGWMGDNLSRFRRDFRIAGVRNNEKGNYLLPDMPNEPEGYPGPCPEGSVCPDACASRTEEDDEEIELELTDADINDDGLFELYKAFNITGDFGSTKNRGHGSFDPSWTAPMLKPEDLLNYQVQANTFRKTMATQVAENHWVIELEENPETYRAFFFEIQFPGPDGIHGFEYTSEVQIIPTYRPFEECVGEGCQGAFV